jgi:hypothetical protein
MESGDCRFGIAVPRRPSIHQQHSTGSRRKVSERAEYPRLQSADLPRRPHYATIPIGANNPRHSRSGKPVTGYIQVITTTATQADAQAIANALVEKRLAGCVQIIGPITSIYRWQRSTSQPTSRIATLKPHLMARPLPYAPAGRRHTADHTSSRRQCHAPSKRLSPGGYGRHGNRWTARCLAVQ